MTPAKPRKSPARTQVLRSGERLWQHWEMLLCGISSRMTDVECGSAKWDVFDVVVVDDDDDAFCC